MARRPRLVVVPNLAASWASMLLRDPQGRPYPNLANVLIVLRNDAQLYHGATFDELRQSAIVNTIWPQAPDADPVQPVPHQVTDDDVARFQEWLQHVGMPRIGAETVGQAIDVFAREQPFHPIREWLDFIEWKGVQRIGSFLHHALGCPDDEYHRQIGAMFLIAMVARIFDPGCQADYMLVLEGPQGEEKSRFCRALASDAFFSDALPRLDTDRIRVSMHLRGKWLIEISELSAFSKSEAGALKAFITQREEIYTPKYGRRELREPRQCLFIGTTNDDEYIRDDTGGRRFWPVKVEKVDLTWLETNREQLFAEAVQAYQEGKPHWPDRAFERDVIAPLQAEKQVFDHWTGHVMDACAALSTVTIPGIWSTISGDINVKSLDMLCQKRIGSILRTSGYRKTKGADGRIVWRKSE